MSEPTKTCTKCGETKPESEYYKTGVGEKRHGSCKTCFKARVAANKDPARVRDLGLQRAYGITSEEYTEKLESQNNVCAICKRPPPDGRKKHLAVDHNHKSGRVRGLLCDNCNRGLGLLGDTVFQLEQAILYLNNYDD